MSRNSLQIGDEVSVLNETRTGTIIKIQGNQAILEDSDGFPYTYALQELVPRQKGLYSEITAVPHKEKTEKKTSVSKANLKVIDLHIEKLTPHPDEISPFERLFIQKEALLEGLERARNSGIKKLEIIHGLGNGTLQKMVYETLESQTHLDFHNKEILHHQSASIVVYLQ